MTCSSHLRHIATPGGSGARWPRVGRRAISAALASILGLMHPGSTLAADTLTQTMQVSNAELATPQGRHAAQERAGVIAARLCRAFRDTRTIAHRETYAACMRDALDNAATQLGTAVAAAQGVPAAPAAAASAPKRARRVAEN